MLEFFTRFEQLAWLQPLTAGCAHLALLALFRMADSDQTRQGVLGRPARWSGGALSRGQARPLDRARETVSAHPSRSLRQVRQRRHTGLTPPIKFAPVPVCRTIPNSSDYFPAYLKR